MSGSQKALKVISIITIVYAVLLILFGALMGAGVALPGATSEYISVQGETVSYAAAALVVAVSFVLGGIINFIIGLLGLRGAKNPRKIGPFYVLCIIGLIFGIISLILSITSGLVDPWSLVSIVITIVCLYLAMKVKKQA